MAAKRQEEEEERARKEKAEKGLYFPLIENMNVEIINYIPNLSSGQQITLKDQRRRPELSLINKYCQNSSSWSDQYPAVDCYVKLRDQLAGVTIISGGGRDVTERISFIIKVLHNILLLVFPVKSH